MRAHHARGWLVSLCFPCQLQVRPTASSRNSTLFDEDDIQGEVSQQDKLAIDGHCSEFLHFPTSWNTLVHCAVATFGNHLVGSSTSARTTSANTAQGSWRNCQHPPLPRLRRHYSCAGEPNRTRARRAMAASGKHVEPVSHVPSRGAPLRKFHRIKFLFDAEWDNSKHRRRAHQWQRSAIPPAGVC